MTPAYAAMVAGERLFVHDVMRTLHIGAGIARRNTRICCEIVRGRHATFAAMQRTPMLRQRQS
jgi:hypothetical protein